MYIRPVGDADIPAVAAIEKVCFSEPWSEKSLSDTLHSPLAVLYCAECAVCSLSPHPAGTLAGYAGMYVTGEDAEITDVAVLPEFRRMGAASELLRALFSAAKERGARYLHLEVRASNAAALALYEKCGFVRDGVRKHFYKNPPEDAVLMTAEL